MCNLLETNTPMNETHPIPINVEEVLSCLCGCGWLASCLDPSLAALKQLDLQGCRWPPIPALMRSAAIWLQNWVQATRATLPRLDVPWEELAAALAD